MMNRVKQYFAERRVASDVARLLTGSFSRRDEARLKGWSKRQTAYGQSFHDTVKIMAELEMLANDTELLALAEPSQTESEGVQARSTNTRQWAKFALVTSLCMVAAMVFWLLRPSVHNDSNLQRYVTRVGEQKTINLQDGSVITLNTATQLLVDITDESRRLVLLRGEAYFDVEKDNTRPFTVDLGGRSVTALGTQFNILNLPEKFILSVTEGEVAVHRLEDNIAILAPLINPPKGDIVRIKDTGQRRLRAGTVIEFDVDRQELKAYQVDNIQRLYNWRSGIIRFDAIPLYKVVQELNRYSAKKILIEDLSIMNLELYTTVRLDRLTEAVLAFEQALPIKVIQRFDRIVIVGKQDDS